MIHDEFEFFIRTAYPQDFATMTAKYPDQSIEELWPESWTAFQHMSGKFEELIAENTKLDRERNNYREKARVYEKRSDQSLDLIKSHFKYKLSGPEVTLKAVQNSLIGWGKP